MTDRTRRLQKKETVFVRDVAVLVRVLAVAVAVDVRGVRRI
jgi:hypothetical protein